MTDKRTRGKPSKIDQLPEDIKSELIELLRDKSVTQTEVLERVNGLIRDAGLPDDEQLSRKDSGLWHSSSAQERQEQPQQRVR